LITRLRLKADNRLQKQAPDFSLIMSRLLGRLKTLQQTYSNNPIDEQLYRHLLQQAKEIQCIQSNVHWDDWDRYSGSQKDWMKFGGLLGDISFQGNLQPFIPTLQVGEWTHIGGKSSFGLGKYIIEYGDINETA
jgi:CRISPR-associated endoribonuclease Cas6